LSAREYPGAAVGTVLFGAAAGYAAAVVGPPTRAISDEFDVSLTAIGLLTSLFFFGVVSISVGAPFVERLFGMRGAVRIAPLLMGAGGVVCVIAPTFWVLLVGRVLVGLGVGLALILGGVVGRVVGGSLLIGLYGGAITVATAIALALGGVLASVGVDWRVNFVVSALLGFSPLPFFAGRLPDMAVKRRPGRELARSFLTWSYWRVGLLFILVAGVPFIVAAWIVHYLTADDAMSSGVAGALGFVLFGISTIVRPLSGKVDDRHHPFLLVSSPFLAAAGFVLLAVDNHPALAVPAILAMGIGFSIPYAISYIRSEDLVPSEPTIGLSAELVVINMTTVVAAPLFGAAFEHGNAELAWLVLAGVAVLAGVVNLPRPPAR